jgi:hypothetical protein
MVGIKHLLNSALEAFSKKWWESCVQHVEKIQDEDFTKEIMWAYVMDKIINLQDSSVSEDKGKNENWISCCTISKVTW